jgi:hypothetical protein
LRNLQDIPRPFVFRPPADGKSRYERGEIFEFQLLVFGRGQEYLAYFIVAFREFAQRGFGIGRGRCRLTSVSLMDTDGHDDEVYSCETQCVRAPFKTLHASMIMKESTPATKIQVEYLTPTEIKYQGLAVQSPDCCPEEEGTETMRDSPDGGNSTRSRGSHWFSVSIPSVLRCRQQNRHI